MSYNQDQTEKMHQCHLCFSTNAILHCFLTPKIRHYRTIGIKIPLKLTVPSMLRIFYTKPMFHQPLMILPYSKGKSNVLSFC